MKSFKFSFWINLPLGAVVTTVRNIETRTKNKVTNKPALSPPFRGIKKLITNSSDSFTNLFHEFFPRIFLSLSSWKRKQTSHWFKTSVFSQFVSWKRNHNKYWLKKFVDSEFKIWWIRYIFNVFGDKMTNRALKSNFL